jgi:hypothetical protein
MTENLKTEIFKKAIRKNRRFGDCGKAVREAIRLCLASQKAMFPDGIEELDKEYRDTISAMSDKIRDLETENEKLKTIFMEHMNELEKEISEERPTEYMMKVCPNIDFFQYFNIVIFVFLIVTLMTSIVTLMTS